MAKINEERIKHSLPELKVDGKLVFLARLKCQEMLNRGYFSHSSPVYGKIGDLLKAAGVPFRYAKENIGQAGNAVNIHLMMMRSGAHRSAILGLKYSQVGVGAVRTPRGGLVVAEFFVGY